MSDERQRLAESFLQEAVYQSRARQAAGVGLASSGEPGPGNCGLGAEAAIDLELTARGEELLASLWSRPLSPSELARIQKLMQEWVECQDALDRKRNHFLRDFRQSNGFDRRAYTKEQAEAFERGLESVNAEGGQRLSETASELLAAV